MADYTVIADVGQTLLDLLKESMQDLVSPASIILASPGEIQAGDNPRLSLFLYQVVENAHLKNQERLALNADTLAYPPLTLDLYYMLTAYGAPAIADKTQRSIDEHKVLGRAMRVLYDNAVVKGSMLRGSLAGTDEELRLSLNSAGAEDLRALWGTFQDKPYRVSACYVVTPVRIDSTRRLDAKRVVEKDAGYYEITRRSAG